MNTGTTVLAGHDAGGDAGFRRGRGIVAALAITQTIGYGTLYYAFAAFLIPLAADLHSSVTGVTGACTASVLTGAVFAIPVGRWLDRHGGRVLMTVGSLAGVLLLIAWANVHTLWQLYLVQIGIGAATAASLYEAAFAVVVTWFTPEHRAHALVALTVVAGFASTIFLPLTGWLLASHGWRTTLLILAAIQTITVPLHAFGVRRAPQPVSTRATRSTGAKAVRAALTDRSFWLFAAGFTANTAAISAMTVHLVAALISWGHPPTFAAGVAGLLGVLSVAGRLLTTGLHRRLSVTTVTAAVFGLQAGAAALLAVVGSSAVGAIIGVIGFGLGFGVATIAKPVVLAQRYDTRRYATLAGVLVVPMTIAKATAPLGAAVLHNATSSYPAVLAAVAGAGLAGAVAIAAAGRRSRPSLRGVRRRPPRPVARRRTGG